MSNASLTIYEKAFNSLKEEAKKKAKEELGNDREDDLCFYNLEFQDQECEFNEKTGELVTYGALYDDDKNLAWVDVKLKVDLDLAVEIIEYYMKKLGKLKTVLEATK